MDLVKIAYSWHDGQFSPLYKFACNNGKIFDEQHQIELINDIRSVMVPRNHHNYDETEHEELKALLEYVKEWKSEQLQPTNN